jgi:hypothetical protein
MADYIIKGEAGKTLDASNHLLGEELLAVNASLRFENLGPDVLSWTCRTESIDAGETIIPDVGQRIELWSASGLARYFRGWVTQARATNYGVQVVAEGPWQWLRKIDVTSSLTSVATDTRPTIIFNEATVKSNIEALLNRAIALGAPIAIGTIATTYTIPKLQLSMMTCADVLAELMRWVPDCVGWWDYNGSGTPTFNLSRRAGMTATTFAVGTAPLEDFDLTGRPDLVPSRVEVKFIERTADGRPEYKTQADGTAATGRVQVIGLSGKELDTFLPPDDYESYDAQTVSANQTTGLLEPSILAMLPQVTDSRAQFANYPRPQDVVLADGEILKFYRTVGSRASYAGFLTFTEPRLLFLDAETGAEVSRVGKNLVISQAAPEWAEDVFANAQKVRIKGRVYRLEPSTRYDFTGTSLVTTDVQNEPLWSQSFPWTATFSASYVAIIEPPANTNPDLANAVFHNHLDFEIDGFLTTSTYSTPTTVYKPQDYEYLSPPANLASNLRSAQNFTPFEGSIRLVYSALPALTNELQYKFNITGAQSSLTAAGALPRAVTYDLAGQSVDIEIGAPSRFNFSTLGGKVRQTPQTNITIN